MSRFVTSNPPMMFTENWPISDWKLASTLWLTTAYLPTHTYYLPTVDPLLNLPTTYYLPTTYLLPTNLPTYQPAYYILSTIYLLSIYYLLYTIYYLQSTIYYLLSTIYYLLSTLYSLLSTLYSLLSTLNSQLSTLYSLLSTLYLPTTYLASLWHVRHPDKIK